MKLLLVTFPVDFGNKKLSNAFVSLLSSIGELDLNVHSFISPTRYTLNTTNPDKVLILKERILASKVLNTAIFKARKENRKILFQGISPALYSYFLSSGAESYIVTDWTRKLYEPLLDVNLSPSWITFLHKKVLIQQRKIFCLTNAVHKNLHQEYQIPVNMLAKTKFPFHLDVDLFESNLQKDEEKLNLLFVGGDLQRKGGDALLQWFSKNRKPNWHLTIVTKTPIDPIPQVSVERDVDYGQQKHVHLFRSHDVFIMPTLCDGYPAVLGEAASAGLAIFTTKNALGASEIIKNNSNGMIFESQQALFKTLNNALCDRELLNSMKANSRKYMEKEFSKETIAKEYLSEIFP